MVSYTEFLILAWKLAVYIQL